jgi:hypothetical protein
VPIHHATRRSTATSCLAIWSFKCSAIAWANFTGTASFSADTHSHGHCGCSSDGALDLLAGFAPLEPSDGFLAEMTNIPTTMAMTMKVSAATTILLKCRRAGRSPILASEFIMRLGCCFVAQELIKARSIALVPQTCRPFVFHFLEG